MGEQPQKRAEDTHKEAWALFSDVLSHLVETGAVDDAGADALFETAQRAGWKPEDEDF